MQEIDHIPRLVNNEYTFNVGREIQPPGKRGGGDHDMRLLILALGGRSRLCPCAVLSKESVQMVVVAKVPGVAVLGQGQVADSLTLQVLPGGGKPMQVGEASLVRVGW